MIQCAPMCDICRFSNSGGGGTGIGYFIQCVNGRDPQNHEYWFWDIDRIFREVHPTAHVDILAGTVGEFFAS